MHNKIHTEKYKKSVKMGKGGGGRGKLPTLPVGRKEWAAIDRGVMGAAGAAAERGGAADKSGRR